VANLEKRGCSCLGGERDVSSQQSISPSSYSALMYLTQPISLYAYLSHTHFLSLTCTEAFEVYVLCYVIHCRMQPPDIVRHML
jgi:hypothetical protein